jgi:Ni,Fe-hydrogenase III small subunit
MVTRSLALDRLGWSSLQGSPILEYPFDYNRFKVVYHWTPTEEQCLVFASFVINRPS